MDGLNMTIIKKLPVPLVPIDLQKDYQKIYQKYEKFKNQLQSYYQESENLFNSLLQRAFKGELWKIEDVKSQWINISYMKPHEYEKCYR